MSEKRVMAWAVVLDGELEFDTYPHHLSAMAVYKTKEIARSMRQGDERVVPVTIVWEEK